jgi:aryl-alcohol dehydrogenase-like predicted oxidoreductase
MLGEFAFAHIDLAAAADGAAPANRIYIHAQLSGRSEDRRTNRKSATLAGGSEDNQWILLRHKPVCSEKWLSATAQMRHAGRMNTKSIPAIKLPLILGCDNKDTWEEGAPVWDQWLAKGGNAFDTAHIYGGGKNEKALGDWITRRGVAKDVVVIAKGAHTPNCTPDGIRTQLSASLERLQINHAPIYIMHRDNSAVPVGEFVEALNAERAKGRIGMLGGSNWSVARFLEAKAYADKKGLEPLRILNNNLSLAVMEKPVWDGCVTSNTPATLQFLRDSGTIHFSWSSQARGYFLPAELRDRLPEDTRPETCFGSEANAERRRRAETLAEKLGSTANTVALAWVLAQEFPSYALIGPRTVAEMESSLAAAKLKLSAQDVAWLNLED